MRSLPRVLLSGLLLLAATATAAPSLIPAAPELAASAWILLDARSGVVLAEHDADERLPPASLTKMMTDYLVAAEVDAGRLSLDDRVAISEKAWRMGGSKMFVRVGEEVRLEDLLRGIVIQSGNDASVAVAEHVAGSEAAFAEMMNQQAQLLGMENSHFMNATGMPHPEHYSSARDLSILGRRLIRDFPDHYAYYAEKEFTYGTDFQTGEPITQRNRNDLLWLDQTVDGIKTGHTEEAGYCLVASAVRDGMRLVSVVMGTGSESARAQESQTLLRWGFRFYETQQLYAGGEELERQTVWQGVVDEVALGLEQDLVLTIPRGRYDELEARVELEPWPKAPIAAGDALGRLTVALDGEVLEEAPLVALQAVEPGSLFSRLWDAIRLFFVRLLA
jgi:D-alanyl-D-alanine carboxypeptidase (penicillin-binding protein 5/6)